ncbi:unnamed protein product [Kuraishia capsulata CBS 1993]|uniref:Aldehyde dehydrogenase n=1 Tax=Kuraishia capsulata CBS 1993 TaxID=1382522 RepID=W6MUQ0_9ASCO|nr:uncharacterized protein KUCA_T00001790001 [Kuraishia capsulata CBS 1993]CDK25820.1 unnamed protein product [Kuraishia capsulata CBS 1993]
MSLEYTSVDQIPAIVSAIRRSFLATLDSNTVEFRVAALKALYFALKDNEKVIFDALKKDFNRPEIETFVFDLNTTYSELLELIGSLPKWLKHQKQSSMPLHALLSTSYIEYIPRGVVLVISPFNYPWMLAISPVVGAIASGNKVVLKPSEQTPHTSALMLRIFRETLPGLVEVVNGGSDQVQALLAQKWDLILFTGSEKVGKIVACEAAKTLTPTVLELGGKSPAIITSNHGDLDVLLDRIMWGGFVNSGQTCVAVDYLLVADSVYEEICARIVKRANETYGLLDSKSEWSHLINTNSFDRVTSIISDSKGTVVFGDKSKWDKNTSFVPPTIIRDVGWEDSTMKQELFAPILPIVRYSTLEEAVQNVTTFHDTPLALYIFSDDAEEQKFLQTNIRSGSVSINDTMVHVGIMSAPFGGIGSSGYGNYHGRFSVQTFSHQRHVFKQPVWVEFLLKIRYPDYSERKSQILKMTVLQKETFAREGHWSLRAVLVSCVGILAVGIAFLVYIF